MNLYNPKDILWKPSFIRKNKEIVKNDDCLLAESSYEKLCEMKGINPIYPISEIPVYNSTATHSLMKKESMDEKIIRKRLQLL